MTTKSPALRATLALAIICGLSGVIRAQEQAASPDPQTQELVQKAITAAGGDDKLFRLFRIREELVLNPDGKKPASVRVSVLEPPGAWWLGKKERVSEQSEPATYLVWAWTLTALNDPRCQRAAVPDITDGDQQLEGVRLSGAIEPPMDVYFDKSTHRLARIDWRSDIHRFSEWKVADGCGYPSRTIGHKKKDGRIWYQSDILEVTRLKELPPDLVRPATAP